ncbi:unnamed protein product, partial [Discosporangium mesarthrocarpum]
DYGGSLLGSRSEGTSSRSPHQQCDAPPPPAVKLREAHPPLMSPRLDDYFRGQAPVPALEDQLAPPSFHGGWEENSPPFPSSELGQGVTYGLSTFSFENEKYNQDQDQDQDQE